jgi:large subunit ribosomal protein L29
MSDEEIRVELNNQRRRLYDLRSQAVTEKLEDHTQMKQSKKDIARLLTERRARELANEA